MLAASRAPISERIVNALVEDIQYGHLAHGDKLPTHRALAQHLRVSVKTVTRAYAEAEKRGIVTGLVGSGTFVAEQKLNTFTWRQKDIKYDLFTNKIMTEPHHTIFRRALHNLMQVQDLEPILSYQPAGGLDKHRAAGARWAELRNVKVPPSEVVVCAGTQHAVYCALKIMTKQGDTVLTECLAYPGVHAAAKMLGLRLVGLPVDDEGLLPDDLEFYLNHRDRPAALICTPTIHNPTLATASDKRRRDLAAILIKYSLPFVEDDIFGHVLSKAPNPIYTHAPELGFYVCATSKSMVPGLRVSFMIGPQQYVRSLNEAIYGTVFAAAALPVELASRWIMDGTALKLVQWHRREVNVRAAAVKKALQRYPVCTADGAYVAWLPLPEPWRSKDFAERVALRGTAVAPAEFFAVSRSGFPQGIRISLAATRTTGQLVLGLRAVNEVLDQVPDNFRFERHY